VVSVLTNSGWRYNFSGGKDIDVTLRGQRQGERAVLIDDPDTVAAVYERLIGELGPSRAESAPRSPHQSGSRTDSW
jgi:hypothetical protein